MRPIRDEMGVAGGVNNLPWLFTGTLIGMLVVNVPFAWLVKTLPRSRFIPLTYRFFALNIVLFAVALHFADQEQTIWVGRAFFIWVSVYNLFVVSIFWQLNVDLFSPEQGKRLFGFIAAGATIGAIVGSAVTASLARYVSPIDSAVGRGGACSNSRCSRSAACRVCRPPCTGSPRRQPRARSGRSAAASSPASPTPSRSPYLAQCQPVSAAVRDHLDVPVFPAGRHRQPELHRPRRADRVLRDRRSAGEHPDPGDPAVPDRADRVVARGRRWRSPFCRR